MMQARVGQLNTTKKFIFAIVTVVGFFVAVEGLLTLLGVQPTVADGDPFVGFESTIPLFVEHQAADGTYLRTSANKRAYFNDQRFPKRKNGDTYRIFCVGGSTVFGRPYDDTTSFVGWLRELLPLIDDRRRWEVINAGGISYASYRVAGLVDELVSYQPDLFIVYTGHNEFLEERTYRSWRSQPDSLRRLTALLHHTRTFSAAHRLLFDASQQNASEATLPAEVDAILDHSVGPDVYHRDPQLRHDVVEHFRFNLNRIVKTAQTGGARVLFVSPAANAKDFSPFKSEHQAGLSEEDREQWSRFRTRALQAEREGRYQDALAALQACLKIDQRYAESHFQLGRVQFAQGAFAAAADAFERAVDEDVCPLRAVPEIERAVEDAATAHQVPLVDFKSMLQSVARQTQGHSILGREFFLDHVHPTVGAHRLLALGIIDALIQWDQLDPAANWRDEAIPSASATIESRIDAANHAHALTNLAQVLSWAGKQTEAGPLALQAIQLQRENALEENPETRFYAAVYLAMIGENEQAADYFQRVLRHQPRNAQARWRLGTLLYDNKQFEEARQQFSEAVRLNPDDAYSHQMLGVLWLKAGNYRKALTAFRRADKLSPGNPGVRGNIEFAEKQLRQQRPERE